MMDPKRPWTAGRVFRWFAIIWTPLWPLASALMNARGIPPGPEWFEVTMAVLWCVALVGVPVTLIDWYRRNYEATGFRAWVHAALRLPAFAFGMLSVVMGVGILAWVAYNVFVARQPEFHWGPIGFPILLIGFGVQWMRSSLRGRERTAVPAAKADDGLVGKSGPHPSSLVLQCNRSGLGVADRRASTGGSGFADQRQGQNAANAGRQPACNSLNQPEGLSR